MRKTALAMLFVLALCALGRPSPAQSKADGCQVLTDEYNAEHVVTCSAKRWWKCQYVYSQPFHLRGRAGYQWVCKGNRFGLTKVFQSELSNWSYCFELCR